VIKSHAMDRVRVGVIGGGLVAQAVHLPLLQRLDHLFAVAALAEPDAVTAERAAARHGIARIHADHRELLESEALDAVLVCSPDPTHAPIVGDALAAGVHVLVEKPLCLTVEEAEAIAAARAETGLTVQVGYMKRFDPAVDRLLEDLDGAPAPRHVATATFDPGMRGAFGLPGLDAAPPADAFLGALVHDVNLVHGIAGCCGLAVDRVVDGFGDGAVVGGTVRLEGGARWSAVWLSLPGTGTFREHVALYADDGVRELVFPAPYALHSPTRYRWTRATSRGSATTIESSWHEAYERQLVHFHACVTEGAVCLTPPEQALADIRLLIALREAAR
jgi:predicted dehydrogenase